MTGTFKEGLTCPDIEKLKEYFFILTGTAYLYSIIK